MKFIIRLLYLLLFISLLVIVFPLMVLIALGCWAFDDSEGMVIWRDYCRSWGCWKNLDPSFEETRTIQFKVYRKDEIHHSGQNEQHADSRQELA